MLILYQTKKNPLHRSHNSHHKQNHNSHVNKFFSLPFVAVITNHEAYRCSARNSSGAARPCGAATPRNSDAHEHIAVPQALCILRKHTRPRPKSGKAVLTPGHAWFLNRAKRSDGSDTTPARNAPVSPCEPLCAILLAKARVYPLSPVKTNVNRLCECDLKPLWKGLSPCRMGRTFSVFQADQAVSGGKQDSRRSLLKRTLRRLCRRC